MKELPIEEKAKAYDEAVRKAKEALDSLGDNYTCSHLTKDDIREMYANFFPELKESEDERIRKHLIGVVELYYGNTDEQEKEDCLAWLKNQGEQIDNANKEYWRGYNEGKQEILDKYAELEKQGEHELSEDLGEYITELSKQFPEVSFAKLSRIAVRVKNWLEKQGEQKLTAWSEEDEEMLNVVIKSCEKCGNEYAYYWLKSLKDRVGHFDDGYKVGFSAAKYKQWKPSEGQLECLGYAIEKAEKDYLPLTNNRIYLTLKELKKQLEKL